MSFLVISIINDLNIHTEGSISGKVVGQTGKGAFTITKIKNSYGKLKPGAGWIYLENTPPFAPLARRYPPERSHPNKGKKENDEYCADQSDIWNWEYRENNA